MQPEVLPEEVVGYVCDACFRCAAPVGLRVSQLKTQMSTHRTRGEKARQLNQQHYIKRKDRSWQHRLNVVITVGNSVTRPWTQHSLRNASIAHHAQRQTSL